MNPVTKAPGPALPRRLNTLMALVRRLSATRTLPWLLISVVTLPTTAFADELPALLDTALKSDFRTQAERSRDRNRRPKETLEFFGLEPDMKVAEIFPGGGWYTKLLVPVLADKGQYYAIGGLGKALGFGGILNGFSEQPGFEELNIVDISGKLSPTEQRGIVDVAPLSLGVSRLDMVLTFRNLHNMTPAGRAELYKAVHKALKRGGTFGVIDHTRRHMQADSQEIWRRLDPVLVIKEITAAGFELEDYSTLHYRADDELRFEVGRASVRGNTDRFTLRFKK